MKIFYLILLFVFTSTISFGSGFNFEHTGNYTIPGNRKNLTSYSEYMFILLMDGCYHLYRLESYIDNTGMSQQYWVYVDPMTYSGTHTICMNPGDFEYLC